MTPCIYRTDKTAYVRSRQYAGTKAAVGGDNPLPIDWIEAIVVEVEEEEEDAIEVLAITTITIKTEAEVEDGDDSRDAAQCTALDHIEQSRDGKVTKRF